MQLHRKCNRPQQMITFIGHSPEFGGGGEEERGINFSLDLLLVISGLTHTHTHPPPPPPPPPQPHLSTKV